MKSSEISFLCSNSLQKFKQIEEKIAEILYFHFSLCCQIAFVESYLRENEAENLQNGDVQLAQIHDFGMRYLKNHLAHCIFHALSFELNCFFRPEFPFNNFITVKLTIKKNFYMLGLKFIR